MYVLVTHKDEENQMKNEGASVVTTLYSYILEVQGQLTLSNGQRSLTMEPWGGGGGGGGLHYFFFSPIVMFYEVSPDSDTMSLRIFRGIGSTRLESRKNSLRLAK